MTGPGAITPFSWAETIDGVLERVEYDELDIEMVEKVLQILRNENQLSKVDLEKLRQKIRTMAEGDTPVRSGKES